MEVALDVNDKILAAKVHFGNTAAQKCTLMLL
jgi:hypothetical protein